MKFIAPSPGAKAVNLLPFFINEILTAFLIPELGCLASIPTFSTTMPYLVLNLQGGHAYLDFSIRFLYLI